MKLKGYVEGFYGRFFDCDFRRDLLLKVFELGLNSYLYAPKEDKFHRICWKDDYPTEQTKHFEELFDIAARKNANFIPAVAPGLSYDAETDYIFLRKKIKYFQNLGAKSFALTLDDIPCRQKLGSEHGELLKVIKNDFPDMQILFCPTVYADDLIAENDSDYLFDLCRNIPNGILILWTGESTISKKIDSDSLLLATELFGKNIVIWDNFYCNDYAPNRIFVGDYQSRDLKFCNDKLSGLLINGTGLNITDFIILESLNAWFNCKPKAAKSILQKYGVPDNLLDYLPLMSSPFKQEFPFNAQLSAQDFFTEIIAKWQSPLKIEWYPALHAIFTQIRIKNADKPFPKEWFDMRYINY